MLYQDIVLVRVVVERSDTLRGRKLVVQSRANMVLSIRTSHTRWLRYLIKVLASIASHTALFPLMILAVLVKDHLLDLDWQHLFERYILVLEVVERIRQV